MDDFSKIWRAFFAIGLVGIAIQQLVVRDFMPVMVPGAPVWLHHQPIIWAFSILLVAASLAILFEFKGRTVSLIMAVVFLSLFIFIDIPFYTNPKNSPQMLGAWGNAFKIVAFCGGAIIVAGTFPRHPSTKPVSEGLIFLGKLFFCTTLIVFGAEHFMYEQFVVTIIPDYIPWHLFWTRFAAIALMASGTFIIIDGVVRLFHHYIGGLSRAVPALLGLMLFLWVFMLHIPRAIADPHSGNGNEWASVFEAFSFSGIAFLIAGLNKKVAR